MTTHVNPSLLQMHTYVPYELPLREKFPTEDHEHEINNWFKFESNENECILPSINESEPTYYSQFNDPYTTTTEATEMHHQQHANYIQHHFPSVSGSHNYSSGEYTNSSFANSGTNQYSNNSTHYTPGKQYLQFSQPAQTQRPTTYVQQTRVSTQTQQQTYQCPTQFSNQSQQMSIPVNVPTMADLQHIPTPQLYQLFAQFQQLIKSNHLSPLEELSSQSVEDKKKRSIRPVRRVRQTRPKVVESKGAIQCKGKNRKKGIQCKNAALMEYIGPRPIYCAEHIELDPKSLYEKCKSNYQKEAGDEKGCKEVVLKEFGFCYKHFPDMINEKLQKRDYENLRIVADRVSDLLSQLEREALDAKKKMVTSTKEKTS